MDQRLPDNPDQLESLETPQPDGTRGDGRRDVSKPVQMLVRGLVPAAGKIHHGTKMKTGAEDLTAAKSGRPEVSQSAIGERAQENRFGAIPGCAGENRL